MKDGILIHPAELTEKWIDRAASLGLGTLGLHPVGGPDADAHLAGLLADLERPDFRALLDYAAGRGICIEYEVHAARFLLPASEFAAHPEYMRVDKNCVRTPDFNFCPSSGALDVAAKNAAALARKLYRSGDDFYFWLDDVPDTHCRCEKCRNLSASDQQMLVMNRFLAEIRRDRPAARLAYLAYHDCIAAPEKIMPDDGIFLEFAPIERDMHRPISECKSSKNIGELLRVFGTKNSKVLEYWLDNSMFSNWTKPPKRFGEDAEVIRGDVAWYRAQGFERISSFACYLGPDYEALYGEPDITAFAAAVRK